MEAVIRAVAEHQRQIFVRALVEVVSEFVMDRFEVLVGRLDAHLNTQIFEVIDIPGAGVAHHIPVARLHKHGPFPERRRQRRKSQRREKVLAVVVRLLDTLSIRIGNEEYARENKSFGLTTLRNQHVEVTGATINIHFRGKRGIEHDVGIRDKRLARIIKQCQDLPGHELFQYFDESGKRVPIDSDDVNEYLRSITGKEFTAKDFRTWSGTVIDEQAILATLDGLRPEEIAVMKFLLSLLTNREAKQKCFHNFKQPSSVYYVE